MSWKIVDAYRKRLAAEEWLIPRKQGGRLSICLVYPERYHVAMSSLGFTTVHGLLNGFPDVVCERAFLPEKDELAEYRASRTPLLSLESQRPVADFDLIAFSVSFESDYANMPELLRLAGLPCFAADRTPQMPLVLAGGAALFLNPEPVAEFLDLICIGEAEAVLPALLMVLQEGAGGREALFDTAMQLPGVYVPSRYRVTYDGAAMVARSALTGAPETVARCWLDDLEQSVTASTILTPQTEFGDLFLVELSRGCPRGCRFCAASFIYHPYRQRSRQSVAAAAHAGLKARGKIGLLGAAVSDFRGIGQVSREIVAAGGAISVSSLRIDGIDDEMIAALKASGHKTVALAPEGPSQRLRDLVRKGITEEQILAAAERLIAHDMLNLKLYFIIGLPTETEADLDEMLALVRRLRERVVTVARTKGRLGEIILSVNPFIPKPFTPLQWCGMEPLPSLERKVQFLRKACGRLANVRLQMEPLKDAWRQALLSRGDRRLARVLAKVAEEGWQRAIRAEAYPAAEVVTRQIPLHALLPWGWIAGNSTELLEREYKKAFIDLV
jgi:radical SAM superfamily enzyme YgiQ (UPF0313 family)